MIQNFKRRTCYIIQKGCSIKKIFFSSGGKKGDALASLQYIRFMQAVATCAVLDRSTQFNLQHQCEIRMRDERHECDTSDTSATQVRHECYTNNASATQVKNFDFDNDTNKTYFHFHTSIFAIWQVKDYKERNNFIRRTTFWKRLFPMPKCVSQVHQKN